MTDLMKVEDGTVVSMHYTLNVDGALVDSSRGSEPLQFIQGMGHIIPGLEHVIYDMRIGDSKTVSVDPENGYGEIDTGAFMDVPRSAFPSNVPLEVGTQLELKDSSGHPTHARIETLTSETVRLNMNHPLAGKRLDFEVTIAGLRDATPEEVSHGHVHTYDHN